MRTRRGKLGESKPEVQKSPTTRKQRIPTKVSVEWLDDSDDENRLTPTTRSSSGRRGAAPTPAPVSKKNSTKKETTGVRSSNAKEKRAASHRNGRKTMVKKSLDSDDSDSDLKEEKRTKKTLKKTTPTPATADLFADDDDESDFEKEYLNKKKANQIKKDESFSLSADEDSDSDSDADFVVKNETKKKVACKPLRNSNKIQENIKKLSDDDTDTDTDTDDDDDEEDIGARLQQVSRERPQNRKSDYSSSSEDEGSESDSDDSNSPPRRGKESSSGGTKRKTFAERFAEKTKRQKLQRAAKQAAGRNDSDSDSDSDIEIVEQQHNVIDLELSDSEDEQPKTNVKNRDSEFARARQNLENAQKYHAEDVQVQSPQSPPASAKTFGNLLRNSTNHASAAKSTTPTKSTVIATATPKQNLGRAVSLKLRTGSDQEEVFTIKMKEPFQALFDKYIAKQKMSTAKAGKCYFHFDGETLSLSATPESYDMEAEDQIDVKWR